MRQETPIDLPELEPEDIGVNPSGNRAFEEIVTTRFGRRGVLQGLGAAFVTLSGWAPAAAQTRLTPSGLNFAEVPHGYDDKHHAPRGYSARVLIRWGDKVTKDAPAFDPAKLTAAAQARQFGYNCDFIAFMPLPLGSRNSTRGLLCVNHEYTNTELMFAGFTQPHNGKTGLTREQAEVDWAAHGLSVVEIRKETSGWRVVDDSRYNRRFTTQATSYRVAGPAAGHARLKTAADRTGTKVMGTLNNCAGGVTPWGTVLSGEENFNGYFAGDAGKTGESANHKRYGVQAWQDNSWFKHDNRFDLEKEPNEPNRFGWIVEFDPYEPRSVPVKRTALGRIKHEGAATVVSRDGEVAVYSGDDERFEYIYRFVSRGKFDPKSREANSNLLDDGTLSVARFDADGTVRWLPLIHGQGPLTSANGFHGQADVLIEARRAADLLGATPMDRPEDVEVNRRNGRVYAVMTNNDRRKPADDPDTRQRAGGANPRAGNRTGHIIEMIPPAARGRRADHTAETYRWEVFLLAGNPADPRSGAKYGAGGVSSNGWLAAPDNLAFDPKGRIWVATDGMPSQMSPAVADGLFVAETEGKERAVTRRFFAAPRGAEVCGPEFTPDGKTLFVAVQHPGEDRNSTFDNPTSRWPDHRPDMPPRPSVVVITKDDGGEIGG